MKNKQLAICIPTYNRAFIIEETLIRSLKKSDQRNWDIYIYDSSNNNDTRIIVEKYMKEFPRLFYKHIDSSVHSNLKVYKIFEDFGCAQEYEYLWVCTDTFTWSNELLDVVQTNLNSYYDLLIVNYRDVENIGTKEISNYNDLFINCAWHMTYYGATIYRIATMLQDVPWRYLKEKYCIPERINFSHVAYCFEKLCTLPRFLAKHLSFERRHLHVSPMKRNTIGWKNDAFYIFCICWPSVVMALPECYYNKDLAIQKHGINSKMFLEDNLIQFREEGIYTYNIYKKYKNRWENLTNISNHRLRIIALFPAKWVWVLQFKHFYNLKKVERRIIKFATSYLHIYIYGCGPKAATYVQYIKKKGIDFNGFLVTSVQEEKHTFMDKEVEQFNPDVLLNSDIGLIIALNKANTQEVMDMIRQTGIRPQCGIFLE